MDCTIGEAARRVGMTVEGLRYYERRGLVSPARRTAAGYRIYEDEQIEALRFVRAAQRMGLSLAEIEELLELRAGGGSCSEVRERLHDKLGSVHERLRLLEMLETQLEAAIERCDERLRSGADAGCPVLDELGSGLATPED